MNIRYFSTDCLLCKNRDYSLFYRNGIIYVQDNHSNLITFRHRLHSYIFSIPVAARLFRRKPRAAFQSGNNTFWFSDSGRIYRYSVYDHSFIEEHEFSKGMNNPLSFCTRYDNQGNLKEVLYGEYIGNRDRGPVSIYRRSKDSSWQLVYEFPAHTIQHIHNIVYDRFKDRYLIMTGDADQESGIWDADIDFKSVKPVVRGAQKYRSCVLIPTRDGLFYITDTPLEQNYVYHLSSDNKLQKIAEIPGPCIFGIEKNGYLYFATSVEGDPALGGWKYRLSNKLGKGVKDKFSHLYRLSQNGILEEVSKMRKDFLPMWLFEFGNMKFPVSDDNKVYVCPQSLKAKYGTYVIDE